MDNNEKDIIDELLKDYREKKEAHENNFGKISTEPRSLDDLPQITPRRSEVKMQEEPQKAKSRQKAPKEKKPKKEKIPKEKKPKKEKVKKGKKPIDKQKIKRALKIIAVIIIAVAIVAGGIYGGRAYIHSSKTAYLKPYIEKYPDVSFPEGIEERFCDYYAQNPNTVGYIEIADIGVKDYVLSANNTKNPVLDRNNSRGELDFNTVVYLPFANELEKVFSTPEGYLDATQKITYSTLLEDYTFNVIGAYYTNSKPEDDNDYVFPYNLTKSLTEKSHNQYTDRLYNHFLYNSHYYLSNKVIRPSSNIITICSKTDFMPDFYFVVVGILGGEAVDFAEPNTKVHYPQAWFDKQGKENPFRFSYGWYPEIYTGTTNPDGTEQTSQQSKNDFTKF